MKNKWMKRIGIILGVIVLILLLGAGAFIVYASGYSRVGDKATQVMENSSQLAIEYEDYATFGEQTSDTGFIFYPGGKVEYTAYAPLMDELAKEGIFCVIPKMPFNLAVFDGQAATDMMEQYPGIQNWYLGGHSLGGAMATDYASDRYSRIDGLVLLAAYPIKDLSSTGLKVLSIYGDQDGVLNMTKYEAGRELMPKDYQELCIKGGNHAQFGDYGLQKGDNEALISPEEQLRITAETVIEFIKE